MIFSQDTFNVIYFNKGKDVNISLLALKECIRQKANHVISVETLVSKRKKKDRHVPWRTSTLTKVMKAYMVCCYSR